MITMLFDNNDMAVFSQRRQHRPALPVLRFSVVRRPIVIDSTVVPPPQRLVSPPADAADRDRRVAPSVAGARHPLPLRVRHRPRRHDRQRRPAHAGRASSAPPPASCSGSSTPTPSSSPVCCSPPAASATASAARGAADRPGLVRLFSGLGAFAADAGQLIAARARWASARR